LLSNEDVWSELTRLECNNSRIVQG
jgi:hypothetical protein